MAISGVVLLVESDLYRPDWSAGKCVAVLGKLTKQGVPVPGSEFILGVNLMSMGRAMGIEWADGNSIPQTVEVNRKTAGAKTGEEFNGLYAATKAAVQSMTQSMAAELGRHNINVNAVCPGAMPTELMETVYRERSQYFGLEPEELRTAFASRVLLPRPLTVEAVAGVVVFVASQQADMMTGQAVNTSGGLEFH